MKISKRHLLNYSILIPYFLLSILGLIVVYSTTSATLIEEGKSAFQLVRNQGIFWVASLVLIALIYKLKLGFLRNGRLIFIVMIVEMVLLALARLVGTPVNGAYGWISVGPVTIQPAEYLKIIIIWYLAHRFSKQQDEIAVYDFQVLTQNQWLPRAFNDWRFVLLVLIGSLGIFPSNLVPYTKLLSQWLMAMALAAIGAKVSFKQFKQAGAAPLLTGAFAWFCVAVSSLIIQYFF